MLIKENFDELIRQRETPIKLDPRSGSWVSVREARQQIADRTGVGLREAELAICRRALLWTPLRVATFCRREDPHEYVDRLEFFRGKELSLSHFAESPLPHDWEEMRYFFEELALGVDVSAAQSVHHAFWALGDFKVTIAKDFSDVTIEVTGLQVDGPALLASIGVELNDLPAGGESAARERLREAVLLSETDKAAKRRGRKAAGWWDNVTFEVVRRIYRGDFKPALQADVERELTFSIEAINQTAAESSIRERARRIWSSMCAEDDR